MTLSRRDLLKSTLGALGTACCPALPGFAQDSSKKLNVVFIAVDDLNDWTGFLGGHPQAKTPNLDRLAKQSVSFTRTYCAAPACNPSRASLLTGVAPYSSGIYHNRDYFRSSPVLEDAVTLPKYFSENGYHSVGRGKIFHHKTGKWADPQSWDEWLPPEPDGPNCFPPKEKRPLNGLTNKGSHFDWGPVSGKTEDMEDFKTAHWCAEFLEQEHDQPFFIACGIYRPHLPWYVPQKYFDMFPLDEVQLPKFREDDLDDIPPAGKRMSGGLRKNSDYQTIKRHGEHKRAVQSYLASIAFADDCVGEVLRGLENGPHKDNTIVVLWGDHGWHLAEKLHWRKFALWEEATRMPLLMHVPGIKGGECPRPASLLDVYPTLVDLCGLPAKEELEGNSLKPLLENPDEAWAYPAITTFGYKNHAVRSERWRYIQYADGSEELYDHKHDPMEWNNLAEEDEYQDIKKKLAWWVPRVNHEPV